MKMSSSQETIEEAVSATIEENSLLVSQWLAGGPGRWGALAGKGVLACRHRLGRKLTDAERRAVWSLLWNRLTILRSSL